MRVRAVIFDFNGVLIDDEHVHFELFRDVLAEEDVVLTEAAYLDKYLGFDDRGAFEAALADAGQPHDRDRVADLIARKAARYVQVAERGLKRFPGATESVCRAGGLGPVSVCSGALRAEVEFGLDRLGVRDRVAWIVAAEDTQRCKPDPEGYVLTLEALRRLQPDLAPGDCLVVEDSLAGIEAGVAAEMVVVGVGHTYRLDQLQKAGARVALPALADFPTWLARQDQAR